MALCDNPSEFIQSIGPRSGSFDGEAYGRDSLSELIAYDQYCKRQQAGGNRRFFSRITKVKVCSPGAVSRTRCDGTVTSSLIRGVA